MNLTEKPQDSLDNVLVEVTFSINGNKRQRISNNPDTVSIVMNERRRAAVKVSMLSSEQKRERAKATDKELHTWLKYSAVKAASRQKISPSVLMKMR